MLKEKGFHTFVTNVKCGIFFRPVKMIKQTITYSFILILTLTSSCTHKSDQLLESKYKDFISLEKKGIAIPIDENTLSSYQLFSSLKENPEEELLYAYNSPMHSLDIFNLSDKTVSHVKLDAEGSNGIMKNVSGICVHKQDSIWLFSQGILYLTDSNGKVSRTVTLPFPSDGFPMVDINFSMSTSKLFYHPTRESIFYLTVTPTEESADYLVYEYFVKTDSFKTYPLKGGNLEKKAGKNFGWKQFPNVTYSANDIVYNFPINSNIYKINIETGKESSFGGQSKYTSNVVSELVMPYTFQDADKHLVENVHFFEIQYDPLNDIYYRLHLDKTNYSSDTKSNFLYNQKDMYLTIFNNKFETIYESKLDSKTYSYYNGWGIWNNRLFITKDNILDENKDFDSFEMDLFEPVL